MPDHTKTPVTPPTLPPGPLVLTITGCPPVVLAPDGEGGFRGIAGYRRPDPPDHRTPIAIIAPAE
jgi:hypothetical protein